MYGWPCVGASVSANVGICVCALTNAVTVSLEVLPTATHLFELTDEPILAKLKECSLFQVLGGM